jgi:hypothetical protein
MKRAGTRVADGQLRHTCQQPSANRSHGTAIMAQLQPYVAPSPSCGPLTRKNDGQRRKRQVKGEKQQRWVEQSCHHETPAAISMPNSQRAPVGMVHANGPAAE